MPTHDARQPPSLLGDRQVATTHELVLDLLQLRPHPPCDGDAPEPEASPSSMTPALSHFLMRRRTLLSAMRCSRNFPNQTRSRLEKKSRISASSTQFTFFL